MPVLINPAPSHIRPIRLDKDISSVTDLVELCFAEAMDADGRAYLRNIRLATRSVNSLYLSTLTPETTTIPFHGYVWEEEGRIVGNVTLIYLRRNDRRLYFIANVAVHPDFRGRGIGYKLTERAIRHVRDHAGDRVMLQVRDDNPSALHIYESLDFHEINRRTNWIVDRSKITDLTIPANVQITRRLSGDWPQQKAWLTELYPENVGLFLPFSINKQVPGFVNWLDRWLNADLLKFWALREGDRLLGMASLEGVNPFQHFLWMATSPAYEDTVIRILLPYIIHHHRQAQKLQVNYPAGRAEEAFLESGMKILNTLIWMETLITRE